MNRSALALPIALLTILPGRVSAQSGDPKDPFGLFAQQPIDNARAPFFVPRDYPSIKPAAPGSWTAKDESWGSWNEMTFVDSKGAGHSLWCYYKDCGQGKKGSGLAPLYVFTRAGQEPYGKQAFRTTFTTKTSQFQFDRATGMVVDPRDGKQIAPHYQSQLTATGSVIRVQSPTASAADAPTTVIKPVVPAPKTEVKPAPKKKAGTDPKKDVKPATKKEVKPEPKKDEQVKQPVVETPKEVVPAVVKELSAFEQTLQNAMRDHSAVSKKSHAEAAGKCESLGSPEERAGCWRPYLKTFSDEYLKEAGSSDALSSLEAAIMRQISGQNAAIKYEESMLKAKGNPKKTKELVAGYRGMAQGAVKGYQGNIEFDVRQYAGTLKPMEQAVDAQKDPDAVFDGSKTNPELKTPDDGVKADEDPDKKKNKAGLYTGDSKKPSKASGSDVPKPLGNLTAGKADPKDNPNKWNDTISGVKGAVWLGLLGLIFGGPVGLVLMATIGFGVMYGISKMNNA